jgi:Methyltransferase domain/Protein of unknown function DUF115
MLHVACVRQGEAFGVEYVERLLDMVRRNLPAGFEGRFVCFTDRPEDLAHLPIDTVPIQHQGWWGKLEMFMFQPQLSPFKRGDRVWYFDLDTVICGPLDKLFTYPGHFGILQDVYRPDGLQSSVMSWIAGTPLAHSIWTEWVQHGNPKPHGGDQEILERHWNEWLPKRLGSKPWPPDKLQELFPGALRSYKVDCEHTIPKGTSVVFFHGLPRPHQVLTGWVPHVWKVGGGTLAELGEFVGTVTQDQILQNVRFALGADYIEIQKGEPTDRLAVICGGGPSLADNLFLIASLQAGGAAVFSVNAVDGFMRDRGLLANFHCMVDARPGLDSWVLPGGHKLYASMCDPAVLARAEEVGDLRVWHAQTDGVEEIFGEKKAILIGGGTTIGLRSLVLAYVMGFRRLMCFGFDGSYRDGEHHAYAQHWNDAEAVLDVIAGGRNFKAAPWMIAQAHDFKELAFQLEGMGCEISLVGDGLLPFIFATRANDAAAQRARQLLGWLFHMPSPVGVEVGVFAGDLSARLLQRKDLTLYMVDSWAVADPESPYVKDGGAGDFHCNLTQKQQDDYCRKSKSMVFFAGERAHVWRMDSVAAAKLHADASLDFVFIDADHSYEGCSADIMAWLPKIKPGGFISGHDYDNTEYPEFGVKRAVDEAFFGSPVILGENFTWRVDVPLTASGVSHGST